MKKFALFGPPYSGKWTIIKAIYQSAGGAVERFEVLADEQYQHMDVGIRLTTDGLTSEKIIITTLPGSPFSEHSWLELIADAAGLLIVIDPRKRWTDLIKSSLIDLSSMGNNVHFGAIQLTKSDLRKSDNTFLTDDELHSMLGEYSRWPWFRSGIDDLPSMTKGVEYLVRES